MRELWPKNCPNCSDRGNPITVYLSNSSIKKIQDNVTVAHLREFSEYNKRQDRSTGMENRKKETKSRRFYLNLGLKIHPKIHKEWITVDRYRRFFLYFYSNFILLRKRSFSLFYPASSIPVAIWEINNQLIRRPNDLHRCPHPMHDEEERISRREERSAYRRPHSRVRALTRARARARARARQVRSNSTRMHVRTYDRTHAFLSLASRTFPTRGS